MHSSGTQDIQNQNTPETQNPSTTDNNGQPARSASPRGNNSSQQPAPANAGSSQPQGSAATASGDSRSPGAPQVAALSTDAAPSPGPADTSRANSRTARKGTTGQHLLGFQYQSARTHTQGHAGQGRQGAGSRQGAGRSQNARRHAQPSRPQKYDRNKFLQANFRFLVSDSVDAAVYHQDADRMFDWQDVIQVEMLTSVPIKCPISLDSPPICPQITPCGHIYSFPAIMQHLVHHGGEQLKRFAPCPLCFEPLVARDLRLALITDVTKPQVGKPVTFQLLQRGKTNIIPKPCGQPTAQPTPAPDPPNPTAPPPDTSTHTATAAAANRPDRPSKAAASNAGPSTAAVGTASVTSASTDSAARGVGVGVGVGSSSGEASKHPLAVNKYAKFAVVGPAGATELWREAAKELATHAAEVMSEGTMDAAQTAPFVYMSLEQLAQRARRWVTHRAEQLVERSALAAGRPGSAAAAPPGAAVVGGGAGGVSVGKGGEVGVVDPQTQGLEAEEAVKQMFVAATQSANKAASIATDPPTSKPAANTSSKQRQKNPRTADTDVSNGQAGNKQPQEQPAWPALPAAAAQSTLSAAAPAWPARAAANARTPATPPAATPAATTIAPAIAPASALPTPASSQTSASTTEAAVQPAGAASSISRAAGGPAAAAAAAQPQPDTHPTDSNSIATSHHAQGSDSNDNNGVVEACNDPSGGSDDDTLCFAFENDTQDTDERTRGLAPPDTRADPAVAAATGAGDAVGAGGVGESVLGTSPGSLAVVNSVNRSGDHYMYQAIDGQWVFLDPLCVRCLLAHYGSYDACPAIITAPIVELESVEQSDITRKRWKFLSHLPLTGSFLLAEVALSGLLPKSALAPFADELAQREKRRQRRAAEERRAAAAEAAANRRAAAARRGPSAQELAAMPALGGSAAAAAAAAAAALAAGPPVSSLADAEALAAARALGFSNPDELATAVAAQAALDAAGTSPGGTGVSFARMAKLGFAAAGPALGSSPPAGAPAAAAPQGVWAGKSGTTANRTSNAPAPATPAASAPAWAATVGSGGSSLTGSAVAVPAVAAQDAAGQGSAKKAGKKGVLLFTSGPARRY